MAKITRKVVLREIDKLQSKEGKYKVALLVNCIRPKIGEYLSEDEVEALIGAGVQVVIK